MFTAPTHEFRILQKRMSVHNPVRAVLKGKMYRKWRKCDDDRIVKSSMHQVYIHKFFCLIFGR